jgi:hypothetical protein
MAVQSLYVNRLMELAANESAASGVRTTASHVLRQLSTELKLKKQGAAVEFEAHRHAVIEDIERFLNRPDAVRQPTRPLPTPPGDPIGGKE